MKKLFSILFAAVILLSGMHLSLATHLCGGEVSAVKFSITDEKASCGMCAAEQTASTDKTVESKSCCKDEMSFLAVDNNYNASTLQLNAPVQLLIHVFDIPKTIGCNALHTTASYCANVQPPGDYLPTDVSLPGICVFLI